MKRNELEHILRAAAEITGADRIVVIGSQAILGQFPDAPGELLTSIEADLLTLRSASDAEVIDGAIGEASLFHQTYGYYAHGVGEEAAVLPGGWKDRLIPLQTGATGGATGLCLECHDLAIAKLVAGRPKDVEFVTALLRNGLASAAKLHERLSQTALTTNLYAETVSRLHRIVTSL